MRVKCSYPPQKPSKNGETSVYSLWNRLLTVFTAVSNLDLLSNCSMIDLCLEGWPSG
jgi:hypothetical protein